MLIWNVCHKVKVKKKQGREHRCDPTAGTLQTGDQSEDAGNPDPCIVIPSQIGGCEKEQQK